MKRFSAIILVIILSFLAVSGLSEELDLSSMETKEILKLRDSINQVLKERGYYPYIELSKGNSGEEVLGLQKQLRHLGYFSSEINGKYDSNTIKAMKSFEKENGLKQDGIASNVDQNAMFSPRARAFSTPTPKPTKTPKPTPTPHVEPAFPLEIIDWFVGEDTLGNPEVQLYVKNNSFTKTIDAFTFNIVCYDAYGNVVKKYGYGDSSFNGLFQEAKIKPQKVLKNKTWTWTLYGFENAKYGEIRLTSVHTTSGQTFQAPPSIAACGWDYR